MNIRKPITNILFATVIALMLSLLFPTVSADYINTTGPTGTYYQYATFTKGPGSSYMGGYDVDAYGDLIYVNRDGSHLDVYQVTLLDSDGDGVLEPDQHPDNVGPDEILGTSDDAIGPMEQRTLTYVTTYNVPALAAPSTGEIYAAADRAYFLGTDEGDVYQYIFATGVTTKVVDSPYKNLAQLGYDDVNGEWYAMSEDSRTVYKWNGSSWISQFTFSSLSGNHPDGLEVITDTNTGIPYVYVSDMSSDYIGQWRYDSATNSWMEENLFQYNDATGSSVEGMGFGALGHIWMTGYRILYEIGGGKLGEYIHYNPLNLSKSDDVSDCVSPGETITYTISYSNGNLNDVTGVTITDPLPAETTFVSCTGGCSQSGNNVTWDIGTVTSGTSGSVTLEVQVNPGTSAGSTVTNPATIESDQTPPTTQSETTSTCSNQPPTADTKCAYVGLEGSPITFDASGSTDPDGDSLTYMWDFDNDGTWDTPWSSSPTATHTWGDDFSGTAKVKVSDGTLTDTHTATVTISNVAPAADAGVDQTVLAGDTVGFSGSFTDPGWLDTHTIEWDFGDGNTGAGLNPTNTYYDEGVYTVTLTVTDDDGGIGTDTAAVTVNPIPATIDIDPNTLRLRSGGMCCHGRWSNLSWSNLSDIGEDTNIIRGRWSNLSWGNVSDIGEATNIIRGRCCHGRWVTAYIELPGGYDVADINVSTVMLNGTVPANLYPSNIGDYDNDGIPDLMVSFDISAVKALFTGPVDAANLTVTGKVLYNGGYADFEGSDTIKVVKRGGMHR